MAAVETQLVFIDEVGFNLTKRWRGRNIGQQALGEVQTLQSANVPFSKLWKTRVEI